MAQVNTHSPMLMDPVPWFSDGTVAHAGSLNGNWIMPLVRFSAICLSNTYSDPIHSFEDGVFLWKGFRK